MENENSKNVYTIIIVVVLIVLVAIGIYSFTRSGNAPATNEGLPTPVQTAAAENKLVAEDQFPGTTVYVSSVSLKEPASVNVYTDALGKPSKLIGTQAFPAGTNPGTVNLNSPTMDGQYYWVGVYNATGSNPVTYTVLKDNNGNKLLMRIKATKVIAPTKG